MRLRLFLAVDLDAPSRSACGAVAECLQAKGWLAKWVPPENYHLTAAFLGGVEEQRVADVCGSVRGAASAIAPFAVPLNTVGAFPSARKPRVAWVGPAELVPAFAALCDAVRQPLATLGFAFE